MTFSVNDSPLAGREGDKVTSRMIATRLMREAEGNVAIKVRETEGRDALEVAGRGELQLGVLVETMRREGFELSISRPRVLYRQDPATGERLDYDALVLATGSRPFVPPVPGRELALQAELGVTPAEVDEALNAPGVQPDHFVPIITIIDDQPMITP